MSDQYEDILVNKFTEESAKDFRKQVINRAMDSSNTPIVVYIDSYGGYIDALNSMLETIEQVTNPIVTVCMGKAMSCGAVLLSAGDYRFCGRNSRVMVHQGSAGAVGPIESLQNSVTENKRLNKQIISLVAKRCNKSIKDFKEEMKKRLVKGDDEARDMYLPAQDALEIGIVDFIGMPHIKPHTVYSIESAPEKKYEPIEEINDLELKKVEKAPKKVTKKKRTSRKKKATKRKVTKKKKATKA